jgi:signal transduction histidine kinase
VDFRVSVEPGLMVYGDQSALAQAVANLLGNAWKYTPREGKRIEITASADLTHVSIVVTDNGVGIPRPEQELIFEKFQRGSAALNGDSVGTGLGLSIVRAIVKAHRGKVDVRSEIDQGSRFRIILPRRRAEIT